LSSEESENIFFRLRIAEFGINLDLVGSGLSFSPNQCLLKFFQPARVQAGNVIKPNLGDIEIKVVDSVFFPSQIPQHPVYSSPSWKFWKTEEGRLVFFVPDQRPVLQLVVAPDFSCGKVVGDFSAFPNENCYPLENLDIRLLSAWLASLGDLLLHASGVMVDDRGYCFVGNSGAGKSTLAARLIKTAGAMVLGEDQIVLRYQGGRFWMYGTPWHMREEMCSPEKVPLEKLFFINRDEPEGIHSISGMDGVKRLLQTAFIPYHLQEYIPRILDRLVLLADQVPSYSISYQLETDPWSMIQAA